MYIILYTVLYNDIRGKMRRRTQRVYVHTLHGPKLLIILCTVRLPLKFCRVRAHYILLGILYIMYGYSAGYKNIQ